MNGSLHVALAVAALAAGALAQVSKAGAKQARFAAPERLLAHGKFVNEVEAMRYPSPVLLDIDSDGQRELVCGDLQGYLWVYEDEGKEGDLEWGLPAKLQSDGKDLKLPNW
jgi:hypothetical protein